MAVARAAGSSRQGAIKQPAVRAEIQGGRGDLHGRTAAGGEQGGARSRCATPLLAGSPSWSRGCKGEGPACPRARRAAWPLACVHGRAASRRGLVGLPLTVLLRRPRAGRVAKAPVRRQGRGPAVRPPPRVPAGGN